MADAQRVATLGAGPKPAAGSSPALSTNLRRSRGVLLVAGAILFVNMILLGIVIHGQRELDRTYKAFTAGCAIPTKSIRLFPGVTSPPLKFRATARPG